MICPHSKAENAHFVKQVLTASIVHRCAVLFRFLRNSALRLDKIDISTYKIGCACVKRLEIANIVIYVLNSGYCSLITKFAYTEPFTSVLWQTGRGQ